MRFRAIPALLALALTAGASPLAAAESDPGEPLVLRLTADEADAAMRDFGPEARARVAPLPLPALNPEEFRRLVPDGGAPGEAESWSAPLARGNVHRPPLRYAGKLFAQLSPSRRWVCTAQFIRPEVILTAAHCVTRSDGTPVRDLVFEQEYEDGTFNGESYPVRCVSVWSGWGKGGAERWKWDYALLRTAVSSATGRFGWEANWQDRYSAWRSIGYPSAIARGETIQVVAGHVGTVRNNVVEMIHGESGFTDGVSGGAWVARYSTGGGPGNRAISVNSFRVVGNPGRIYGPYFDDNFKKLLDRVTEKCG